METEADLFKTDIEDIRRMETKSGWNILCYLPLISEDRISVCKVRQSILS